MTDVDYNTILELSKDTIRKLEERIEELNKLNDLVDTLSDEVVDTVSERIPEWAKFHSYNDDAYIFPTQENDDNDYTFDHNFLKIFISYLKTKDEEELKYIETAIAFEMAAAKKTIKDEVVASVPVTLIVSVPAKKRTYGYEQFIIKYQHNCIMNYSVFIQSSISDQKTVWGPWIYYIHGPLTRSKIFLIIQYLLFNHQTTISKCGCIFNISAFNI